MRQSEDNKIFINCFKPSNTRRRGNMHLIYLVIISSLMLITNIISEPFTKETCAYTGYGNKVECVTKNVSNIVKTVLETTHQLSLFLGSAYGDDTQHHIIHSGTFSHLSNLTHLIMEPQNPLGHCFVDHIITLENGTFEGLESLRYLRMNVYTSMEDFPRDVFKPLISLNVIDISRTGWFEQDILNEALSFLPSQVHTIILKKAYNSEQGHWGSILDLASLVCNLSHTHLSILDLSYNSLANVQVRTDEYGDCAPFLRELHLNDNLLGYDSSIAILEAMQLMNHPSLELLNLGYQWFTSSLDNSRFWTTSEYELDLPHRDTPPKRKQSDELEGALIEYLITYSYARLREKQDLEDIFPLNDEKIKALCQHIESLHFSESSSTCLGIMDIWMQKRWNESSCMYGMPFPIGPKLNKVLYNDYTTYQAVERASTYHDFSNVCFMKNNIERLDYSGHHTVPIKHRLALNYVKFKGLLNLKSINFENNETPLWNTTILHGYPLLEKVSLSRNILHIHNDSKCEFFKMNKMLKNIDISRCRIHSIPREEFRILEKLEMLDLSLNKLKEDTLSINLAGSASLKVLNLSRNHLTGLNEYMRHQLDRHTNITVDLSDNPFTCDCNNIQFIQWFQRKYSNKDIKFTKASQYICSSDGKSARLSDPDLLLRLESHCNSNSPVIIGIASSFVTIAILIVLYVIYNRRWRIQYQCLKLMDKVKSLTDSKSTNTANFQYDAFVLYNQSDRFWVHDVLRYELEETFGFTLCLHYRDFEPGVAILDNVENAIRSSNKIIAVLSPNFLSSDWCIDELYMSRSFDRNKIILVLLDAMDTRDLPPLVSLLMDTRTYLEWSTNPQVHFFKRLARAVFKNS